jgi:hypothetical protein
MMAADLPFQADQLELLAGDRGDAPPGPGGTGERSLVNIRVRDEVVAGLAIGR